MKRQTKFGLVLAAAAVISVSVASLVCARGWVQQGADWFYVDNNNEFVTDTIQSSGNSKFYLGETGAMVRDYFLEDYNDNTYYFGSNGAMVTNTWVAVDSSLVENQGDYVPDNYWYYFQASGKAMKGSSTSMKKSTIDGKKYGFNEYGQMVTGWVDSEGKVINPDDESNPFINALYYAGGDNDGVLRAGWVTYYDGYDGDDEYQTDYTNLYFYFNTSNNKKYGYGEAEGVTKKINGRTYAFNSEGIMLSGWDVYDNTEIFDNKITYFSGEDDGHQVKKGWVYAVPSQSLDADAYDDDEEKYMYFASSGDIVRDSFKKVNGKFYVFNRTGIMKTGVVIWCPDGVQYGSAVDYKYVNTLDLDWAEGSEVAKKGILRFDSGADDYYMVNANGRIIDGGDGVVGVGDYVKLHLFGDDGARKTGLNSVEFSDDTFTLNTNASGDKGSGVFAKKYYSLGIQLKASSDIRFGIYNQGDFVASSSVADYDFGDPLYAQYDKANEDMSAYYNNLESGNYLVLTTGGAKQKGNRNAKKDADGNYWVVDNNNGTLKGIFTVNVKTYNNLSKFETKAIRAENAYDEDGNPLVGGEKYGIDTLIELGLASPQAVFENGLANDWVWSSSRLTFTKTGFPSNNVHLFQSDYGEGSNKWIPFGLLDNSNKTVTFDYLLAMTIDADEALAYAVKPNNDYFLNCYWAD